MGQAVRKIDECPVRTALEQNHLAGMEMNRGLHGTDHGQRLSGTLLSNKGFGGLSNRLLPQLIGQLCDGDQRREVKQQQRHLHRQQSKC